jgi:hypothetical protein
MVDIITPYVQKFCEGQEHKEWYKKLVDISFEIQRLKQEELNEINVGLSYGGGVKAAMMLYGKHKDKNHIKYLSLLTNRKRIIVKDIIVKLSKYHKTSFVFGLLNDSDFSDIDENNDFGTIKKPQYNRITGARAYYNRLLKCISKQSKIEKNLTSHLARHSYTSLMVELGEDISLFDIMNSLGHKHITTTQTYLQKFTKVSCKS